MDVEPAQAARSPAEALPDRRGIDRHSAQARRAGSARRRRPAGTRPRHVRRRTATSRASDLHDPAATTSSTHRAGPARDRHDRRARGRKRHRHRGQGQLRPDTRRTPSTCAGCTTSSASASSQASSCTQARAHTSWRRRSSPLQSPSYGDSGKLPPGGKETHDGEHDAHGSSRAPRRSPPPPGWKRQLDLVGGLSVTGQRAAAGEDHLNRRSQRCRVECEQLGDQGVAARRASSRSKATRLRSRTRRASCPPARVFNRCSSA